MSIKETIDEHIESVDEDNPKDLIDDYLIAMKKGMKDPDNRFSRTGGYTNF